MPLLEVTDLHASYGPVAALRGLSLHVDAGETLAIVGANGAGKTTLTLALSGALSGVSGTVRFDGKNLRRNAPEGVARAGIALVPEGRRIFDGLTVAENLLLGQTVSRLDRAGAARKMEMIHAMFPILHDRRGSLGTRLSGGEQQQLAIARALLSDPRLLILDEPSLGLAPLMVEKVYAALAQLKSEGLAMILVEQNPVRVGLLADRMIVLANGVARMQGRTADLLRDPALSDAYLSGRAGTAA